MTPFSPAPDGWRLTGAVLFAALLAACGNQGAPEALDDCPSDVTPIASVQGSDAVSPRLGESVAVMGVITRVAGNGLTIESLLADDDPLTSEGLFLQSAAPAAAFLPGRVVVAEGRVAELGEGVDTQTALTELTSLQVCGEPEPRPLAAVTLPLDAPAREALESMRVSVNSASLVTDVYRLHEGAFSVALDSPLPQATEVARPGGEARARMAQNRQSSLDVLLAPGDTTAFAVGDELLSDAGVLGHDGRGQRLFLEAPARLLREPVPSVLAPPPGVLRLASLNLQNYFNGDGAGDGFPTSRGAETVEAFGHQRRRLGAAVAQLHAHVLAVMELENDGFGDDGAARDFLADLVQATGHDDWRVAQPAFGPGDTGLVGSDEITVGLFYRGSVLEALGPARLLDAAPFDLLSRTPLAQAFRHRSNDARLLVAVNHFKSKGSCPEQGRDRDQGDGQGCWNRARTLASRALGPWVEALSLELAGGRGLVLGDLNAYRMEDPVQQLLMEGFVDLTATAGKTHRYSYVYYGRSGTLDHALATPVLTRDVAGARILNTNAGWPRRLPLEPAWLGVSDHDPVLVDLRLTQSSTSD